MENPYESERIKGLKIEVVRSPEKKCERCWNYDETVAKDENHPALCSRCVRAVTGNSDG
jgi:isoleucyl-tRNA synthetase